MSFKVGVDTNRTAVSQRCSIFQTMQPIPNRQRNGQINPIRVVRSAPCGAIETTSVHPRGGESLGTSILRPAEERNPYPPPPQCEYCRPESGPESGTAILRDVKTPVGTWSTLYRPTTPDNPKCGRKSGLCSGPRQGTNEHAPSRPRRVRQRPTAVPLQYNVSRRFPPCGSSAAH